MKTFKQLYEQINRARILEASAANVAKATQMSKDHGHDHHRYSGEINMIARHMDQGHDYKTARNKAMGSQSTAKPAAKPAPQNPTRTPKKASGSGSIHVHSDYEDGHGPVKVHLHDTKTGEKHTFNVNHGGAEDHGDKMPSSKTHSGLKSHLSSTHGLAPHHATAVANHFRGVTSDEGHAKHGKTFGDSNKSGYTYHSIH